MYINSTDPTVARLPKQAPKPRSEHRDHGDDFSDAIELALSIDAVDGTDRERERERGAAGDQRRRERREKQDAPGDDKRNSLNITA